MKYIIPTSILLGLVSALPAPEVDPIRVLPLNWEFEIVSTKGPACHPEEGTLAPRPTYGANTVDGTEIYYWFFAYPQLRASVGKENNEDSVWCETTVKYTETDGAGTATNDYRLGLRKNGTRLIAVHDLEEGVTADWKFTYYPDNKEEIVDELVIKGPYSTGKYQKEFLSTPLGDKRWALPKCGSGLIKFRTDLTVKAKKRGAKGEARSEIITPEDGSPSFYYGTQQGVSYDFTKCAK